MGRFLAVIFSILLVLVGLLAGGCSIFGSLLIAGNGGGGDMVPLVVLGFGIAVFCFWAAVRINRKKDD